jgi:uncharacterized membrane protein (UPF0127 family)
MTFFRRHLAALVVLALVLIAGAIGWGTLHMSDTQSIKDIPQTATTASTTTMHFEIADTAVKQELGLGNRSSVPDNYGMLFVFKDKARYGFWMKDMLVPIDITWLSDTGTIILIDHSVNPDTYPRAFYPPVPVKYVLETRAGYAADHGWEVGTQVSLPAPYGP